MCVGHKWAFDIILHTHTHTIKKTCTIPKPSHKLRHNKYNTNLQDSEAHHPSNDSTHVVAGRVGQGLVARGGVDGIWWHGISGVEDSMATIGFGVPAAGVRHTQHGGVGAVSCGVPVGVVVCAAAVVLWRKGRRKWVYTVLRMYSELRLYFKGASFYWF